MDFPWYEICNVGDDSLEQGDFIPECPIVIPPPQLEEGDNPEFNVQKIDSLILSQSCDLAHGKLDIVLVCPYYPLKDWLEASPYKNKNSQKKAVDDLRKGYFPAYHLLNKPKNLFLDDYQVVDFRNVYGINYMLLKKIMTGSKTEHLRLLPPYREHLSQAFARYFMRVGLPQDLRVELNY